MFHCARQRSQPSGRVAKPNFLDQLRTERLIGIVRADVADDLAACAEALSRGGINCLEIAMTTPAAIGTLTAAVARIPEFYFGLGTVLDVETARLGILAGAKFIVTPAPRPQVITLCRRYHVPVISGAFSRSEIIAAHKAGANAVKVYPGEQFGPAYISSLKEELQDVPMIPIGGVTPPTVAEFLRAGAFAAFAGSALIEDEAINTKDWSRITQRAATFVSSITAM
jgi:2-dehydro-3-deoxyphosphogluconate aldolase/(4S)-4-hydroxy-2-oxoglutarate aldolase